MSNVEVLSSDQPPTPPPNQDRIDGHVEGGIMDDRSESYTQSEQQSETQGSVKKFIWEVLQTVIMALILYFLIDSVIARVRVENISMVPTLQPGELLLVNKLSYKFGDLEIGDIVVFPYPLDPREDFIKRVIGLPGDRVEVYRGAVTVNGEELNEPYLDIKTLYTGSWLVPEDQIFVLGDNRNKSSDSHSWGFVPIDTIVGKALLIYWPPEEIRILDQRTVSADT